MEIASWVAMLERRGYQVQVRQEGAMLHYTIAGVSDSGRRGVAHLHQMTYKNLRKQIDSDLGHGMQHCLHDPCALPLLKAQKQYTRYSDPFYNVEEPTRQMLFYTVPRMFTDKPVTTCPRCGGPLTSKTVHRVTDPEEFQ